MRKAAAVLCLIYAASAIAQEEARCEAVVTTIEINQCALLALNRAQAEMDRYLHAILERAAQDLELVEAINLAQENWKVYRDSHCESVYIHWREGTIRGVMALSCKENLTRARTHELWSSFLDTMDSASTELPEPAL